MTEILYGPDLSRYNILYVGGERLGEIDEEKFKELDACAIKLTEGWGWLDPVAYYLVEVCERTGVPYMTYHYWHPALDQNRQADWAVSHLDKLKTLFGRLPPMGAAADVETNNRLQREVVDKRLRYFLPRMHTLLPGSMQTIYTRKTVFDPYVSTSPWYGENYHLWVAHYETQWPWIPASWSKLYGKDGWDMHQIRETHSGGAYGIPDETIDWNRIKDYMIPDADDSLTAEEMLDLLWETAIKRGWDLPVKEQ